ncbi:hypothetical protein [Leptothermofonsia sichuanensis]|nr:hypothetical protein [Leptothermofonsia sichuanensis]
MIQTKLASYFRQPALAICVYGFQSRQSAFNMQLIKLFRFMIQD